MAQIKGEFYGITREDEEKKLVSIQRIADEKIEIARGDVFHLQEELHELKEVYDAEDKEGLAQWINTDARFQEVRQDLLRAERARKKPFFGRIDFEDETEGRRETYYVGKTVIAKDPANPLVVDWRAPISSIYYGHSLGKQTYKVPDEGILEVDLKRKRTYEIEDDKIKDYYDSDVVANDELLTKYLSKSRRSVLSEIIATIQEEQNEVIRKNPHHNVVVQGSAGSGKTTVAMHRISYILYNFDKEFKPEGFYIVGSNKVLLNYITGVLPDLDVYGVSQMTMETLFTRLLYEDWDTNKYTIRKADKTDSTIGIKGTTEWFNKLTEFAGEVEHRLIPMDDIKIEKNEHILMKKSDIESVLRRYPKWSLKAKIDKLNDILESRLELEIYGKYYSYNEEEQKALTRHFKNYFSRYTWQKSTFDLYDEFMERMALEDEKLGPIGNTPDLYDLASVAYLYKILKETEVIQEASHVIIDEAQDFGIMIYHSLNYCLSKCTFTIMGDVAQNINLNTGLGDWEELKKIMLPDRYDYFGLLRKSYRNTVEISKFATDILRHATFPIYPVEPIIRHGDEVNVEQKENETELNKAVLETLKRMKADNNETIALICKDIAQTKYVYEALSGQMEMHCFSDEDSEFANGVMVLPIEYAKGLEFDAVVIYDASAENYPKNDGFARLLYVAATRALHELKVFHTGELTGLIKDPIDENRNEITTDKDDYHLKPFVFQEEFVTKEEKAARQSKLGDDELSRRNVYGPKRISTDDLKKKPEDNKPIGRIKISQTSNFSPLNTTKRTSPFDNNYTPYGAAKKARAAKAEEEIFGSMPEGTALKPVGHGKIDTAVRWIKADKTKVDITSNYGILRVTPVSDETVRIQFSKGEFTESARCPEEITPNPKLKWNCIDNRTEIEIRLCKITIKVDKRTGAMSFVNSAGNVFLCENSETTRQYQPGSDIWWEYFEFGRKESLSARGNSDSEWMELPSCARYISFNEDQSRSAILMSSKGYQIVVPASTKVLVCTVPAYGPYVCFSDKTELDYYVRYAR